MTNQERGFPLRPEHLLALERFVRNELALQRLLAASRRLASMRLSAIRQVRLDPTPALPAPLASLPRKVA